MGLAVLTLAASVVVGQTGRAPVASKSGARTAWVMPRTPEGKPDFQGVWDYRTATPLERPKQFAGREFMTDAEVTEFERRAAEREDGRPPEDARSTPSVHPPWWLDYGKRVVGTKRSSLIVDPPDGRIPPLSPEGERRAAARAAANRGKGPADAPEDRNLWERCITRGLPEGILPAGYNNNLQIVQTADFVVLASEMIHDARIVPLDGRPRLPVAVRRWLGDSRGRWEGDALVVETANFPAQSNFRGSAEGLRLTERFTRVDADRVEYRFTVEDPATWTRPWTVTFPLVRSEAPIYEYACHEGNYSLQNILKNGRAADREAAQTAGR